MTVSRHSALLIADHQNARIKAQWANRPTIRMPDGTVVERPCGTPQGSAVSPVLANLFMHYAFDSWLEREFPAVEFERFADDAVVHCATERQARQVWAALSERMESVGLRLHPDKTKLVYCKDRKRRRDYPCASFTFLGYTFRARKSPTIDQKSMFAAFLPAMSGDALKAKGRMVRRWRLNLRTTSDLGELARWMNPIIRGWMNYYGKFYRTEMFALLRRINTYLVRWARRKFKRLSVQTSEAHAQPVEASDLVGSVGQDARRADDVDVG